MTEALVLLSVVGLTALLAFQAGRKTAKPQVYFHEPFDLYYRDGVFIKAVVTDINQSLHGGVTFSGSDLSTVIRRFSIIKPRSDHE